MRKTLGVRVPSREGRSAGESGARLLGGCHMTSANHVLSDSGGYMPFTKMRSMQDNLAQAGSGSDRRRI